MHFDTMNETDVREIIVRPLIERLGYRHGTLANVRTEVSLRYAKAFLGRKNPTKDPDLVGRADYICEAVSYARWTVEVKSPQQELSRDDLEQAHTYSAHPEIAASYMLLTNGREFQLYAVSQLEDPLLQWRYEETSEHLPALFNLLGYEALKRQAMHSKPDLRKPLAEGLRGEAEIIGGILTYGRHSSNHALFQNTEAVAGLRSTVTGRSVRRTDAGLIVGDLTLESAFAGWAEFNRLSGIDSYEFATSDEFVSSNQESPTIFQNVVDASVARGTPFQMPGLGMEIRLPFGFDMSAYTQAIGFIDDDRFRGFFEIEYQFTVRDFVPTGNSQFDMLIQGSPRVALMSGEGTFEIRLR